MGFWTILSLIWQYRAQLWQILNWLNQALTWVEISEKLAQFDKAATTAQQTGNTSGLENIFNGDDNKS